VRGVLVDTGPLVATIDRDDEFHERCVALWREMREPLLTVWPVITEAMHLVGSPVAQERLWDVIEHQALQVVALGAPDVPRMRALMKKYSDRPMDLAHAAIVRVAERDGVSTIVTIDRDDFAAYRLHGSKRFRILP
jgi:predicted nucleic acid-binding protein